MNTVSIQLPEGFTFPHDARAFIQNQGYIRIRYRDPETGKKRFPFLHRLIWQWAYGPIPDGYVVHHINADIRDNRLENLRCMPVGDHSRMHRLNRELASPDCARHYQKNRERERFQYRRNVAPKRRARRLGLSPKPRASTVTTGASK